VNRIFILPIRFPKAVLAILAALTLFFLLQIPRLEVNNNPWDFLPTDTPERVLYDHVVDLFGTKDMVMIAVVADEGVIRRETLGKIAELTEAIDTMDILDASDLGLLERAMDRADGRVAPILESLRAKGLDRESVGELNRALALLDESKDRDRETKEILRNILVDIEPVEEVTSLTTIEQVRGTEWGLEVGQVIDDVEVSDRDLIEIRKRVLSDKLLRGLIVSTDARATLITVKLSFDETDSDRAVRVYSQLKSIVEPAMGPEQIYIAGVPMAMALSGEYVHRDLSWLFPAVTIMIVLVLFLSFGTVLGVLLPLIVVLMSVTWSVGALALVGIPLSMMLSSMPMFLVAVGSAYGIHVMSGYYEALLTCNSRKEATEATMRELSRPVAMACLTTIIGFGSLATSSVKPIQYFGSFTAFGVLSAMILTLMFIPAVLVLWGSSRLRRRRIKGIKGENFLAMMLVVTGKGVVKWRIPILVLYVVFVATAFYISTKIKVGEDFIGNFREGTEIRKADAVICKDLGGVGTLNVILSSDDGRTLKEAALLTKIDLLQGRLDSIPGVGKTLSLADFVKVINQAMHENDPSYFRIPAVVETELVRTWEGPEGEEVETVREEKVSGDELIAQYLMMYESAGGEELGSVVDYPYRTGQISALLRTSSTIERERIVRETERYIDEIFQGEKDLNIMLSGLAALDMVVVRLLTQGQVLSLAVSLGICFLVIVFVYRSARVGIVCLTPLVLTILLNFAVIVLSGNTLNFGTAATASIAIGIGIDYGIHFVSKYRLLRREGKGERDAIVDTMQTTGKAIIFNAVSVAAGFLVLLFSVFVPVTNIGWVVALMMLSSALGALIVLPAMLPILLPRG
jgi:predicted RND superfamily exporter protein